ncbi:copper chaperone PCu(A)C [Streptomyces sp. MAR4 CNX-425]|uniref:copper chaperone PCu(A)C n=1 Tax=Streptomyces sp. MAR4 CNX-425 TaxID=3406343 RepID=UPI003B4FFA90
MSSTRSTAPVAAVALALALGLSACSAGDDSGSRSGDGPRLRAEGGFVPRPVLKDLAAGYLTVRNDGAADDRLTAVSTDLAADVTLHTSEGERMRAVDGLDVPASGGTPANEGVVGGGGELTLARGGAHLMLEKLDRRPEVGEKVSSVLHFATSEPIEVEVPVRPTTYRPAK